MTILRCSECKGTDVQIVMWVRPNKGNEIVSDFGSYDEKDTKWCVDCEAHILLEDFPK